MDAKFEEAVASYWRRRAQRESGGGGWLRQSEAVQMTFYDVQISVSEPPFVNYIMTVKGQQI